MNECNSIDNQQSEALPKRCEQVEMANDSEESEENCARGAKGCFDFLWKHMAPTQTDIFLWLTFLLLDCMNALFNLCTYQYFSHSSCSQGVGCFRQDAFCALSGPGQLIGRLGCLSGQQMQCKKDALFSLTNFNCIKNNNYLKRPHNKYNNNISLIFLCLNEIECEFQILNIETCQVELIV